MISNVDYIAIVSIPVFKKMDIFRCLVRVSDSHPMPAGNPNLVRRIRHFPSVLQMSLNHNVALDWVWRGIFFPFEDQTKFEDLRALSLRIASNNLKKKTLMSLWGQLIFFGSPGKTQKTRTFFRVFRTCKKSDCLCITFSIFSFSTFFLNFFLHFATVQILESIFSFSDCVTQNHGGTRNRDREQPLRKSKLYCSCKLFNFTPPSFAAKMLVWMMILALWIMLEKTAGTG